MIRYEGFVSSYGMRGECERVDIGKEIYDDEIKRRLGGLGYV
jgi:hypothetical protein